MLQNLETVLSGGWLVKESAVTVTISVKWRKEVFKSVKIDTSQPPYVFKCQLYDLTGVPPERQKIMVKGGLLKDDADWSTVGVKQGLKLMMMGTADEVVKAPEKGPVFMEDLPEEEQALSLGLSAELFNLGNTCYMNSTIQCLHSVPELKSALLKFNIYCLSCDQVLRKKYPQFSQLHNGVFMQQDAEECWTQLLYTLSQSLQSPGSSASVANVKSHVAVYARNTDKILSNLCLTARIHCQDSGEESSETESTYFTGGEPFARWYLTIHFVRFFWKRESNQKAKILRKVDYPLELDVYDLCSDELRKRLEGPRRILRDEEGKKLGLKANEKSSSSKDGDVKMTDAGGSSNASGKSSAIASQEGAPSDKETCLTGIYDLVSVLTHKGKWIEFDDDNPIPQREEDIVKLSGGVLGDWHMAYISMYKSRTVSM
ncbi:Ubiquitin carboxyl-terminal hydrolase 7 [Hibiscus syriacus]|uniref:ubiquitinyl hydrolase 1 n=1 Tax=Hibiscus syriacus TaxID=106335 RepID=A0A6A3BVS9_HIBSY|nr:Ubiquitin carboxyl-terminal hydrolase 7 [Hibiscus syriacus]